MNRSLPQIYLLSGIGADSRLLAPQVAAFSGTQVLEWIQPIRGESVRDYARRISAPIPPGELIIGGVSFGGVIAQEIARQRPCLGVILVSSLRSPRELASVFQLGRRIPGSWLRAVGALGALLPIVAKASHEHPRRLCLNMPASSDPVFLSWAMDVLARWDPPTVESTPLLRVHGTRDFLIRPGKAEIVQWIQGGGHLSNLTHAEDVNEAIAGFLRCLL